MKTHYLIRTSMLILAFSLSIVAVIADTEPNDTWQQANNFPKGSTVNGTIGDTINNLENTEDWYKIEVPNNSNADFIYIPDSAMGMTYLSSLIFFKHSDEGDPIYVFAHNSSNDSKKFSIYNLSAGIYYLRVFHYANVGTYTLHFNTSVFNIGFDLSRYNNTIKILNYSTGGQIEYDFGDGNYSISEFPEHTYDHPGDFIVTQKVWINSLLAASIKSQSPIEKVKKVVGPGDFEQYFETQKLVSIKGIECYFPNKGGTGGDFILKIYGGGLDETLKIKLIKDDKVLTPDTILIPKNIFKSKPQKNEAFLHDLVLPQDVGFVEAVFDFHFAETGIYDVSIGFPGEEPTLFENGLTIEGIKYPYVKSSIEGYNILRTGIAWKYHLSLTNTGNILAKGINAYIILPDEVEFSSDLVPFSNTLDKTKSFNYYDAELDTTFSVSNQVVKDIMDSLRTEYIPIDTLFGSPFAGRVYHIYVPKINAGETLRIPFMAKSVSSIASLETAMYSFVLPINIYGSCDTPISTETVNKLVDLMLANLDKVPIVDKNPYLKAFVKTANMGKTALRNAGSYFGYLSAGMSSEDAWYNAYISEGQLDQANAEVIAGLKDWALDLGLEQLQGLSKIQLDQYKKNRSNYTSLALESLKKGDVQGKNIWKGLALDNQERFARLEEMKGLLDGSINFKNQYGMVKDNTELLEQLIKTWEDECPENKGQGSDVKDKLLDNSGEDNMEKKDLSIGTSIDPNEKEGPHGFTEKNYISINHPMNYTIRFENLPAATLPAQIVNIFDTLDLNVFDLSTFELGDVTIGHSTIYFPPGRTEYFTTYNMRPVKELKTGISAKLDALTGIIHWQFISLDPDTEEPIEDPLLGFLPPNVIAPEGEGSVSFRIKLKNSLPDESKIQNKASIIFDYNEPIITNNWINTVDLQAPVGSISGTTQLNDSMFTVTFGGTDTGSQIRYYNLYCSVNSGSFVNIGRFNSKTVTLKGETDKTYGFCAVPEDSTGNVQSKIILAEQQITLIKNFSTDLNSIHKAFLWVYPNPAQEYVTVKTGNILSDEKCRIELIAADGKKTDTGSYSGTELENGIQLSMKKYPEGLYLLRVIQNNINLSCKITLK